MATHSVHPFRSVQAKTEYVRVSGSPTAPPLVLLPGLRGTSLMWVPVIAALAQHYRVYAPDTVTDVGLSVPRGELSTAADPVRWLDELFGVLSPQPDLVARKLIEFLAEPVCGPAES